MYAIRQKKRAEKAIGMSKPFGSDISKFLVIVILIKISALVCQGDA